MSTAKQLFFLSALSLLSLLISSCSAGGNQENQVNSAGVSIPATAYQMNASHSGQTQFGQPLNFTNTPAWSVTLGGAISYPVIANWVVFVTTAGTSTGGYGTQLYALDESTGNSVWGPVDIPSTFSWSGHTYDNGKIFVVNFDGLLQSFDATTGKTGWSMDLPGQYSFTSPPTAIKGVVYTGGAGSGGTLFAVDESNGYLLWSASVANGDHSSPAISSDGVFVSYPCQVYKFAPSNGALLWQYNRGCDGGGGRTPAYSDEALYVRDWTTPQGTIYNAASGAIMSNFAGVQTIPAISGQTGFFMDSGTLRGIDLSSGNVLWSFAGDGKLVSAPIVIDQTVIAGSSSGEVYALDATTGSQIWSGQAGAPISGPDEQNPVPLTGLAAGDGYLIVPAGKVLTAWRLVGQ